MPRAKFEYSAKPYDSIFEIKERYVLKKSKPVSLINKKINARCQHHLYIWIMKESVRPTRKGIPPKFRKIKVLYFYKPLDGANKYKYIMKGPRWVTRYQVTKYLRNGYEVIDKDCPYYYTDGSIKNFYRKIQML